MDLKYDWDDANIEHAADEKGFTTEEVEEALEDPHRQNGRAYNQTTRFGVERRRLIYGQTGSGLLLVVVYTLRNGKVRPISARIADAEERRDYRRNRKHR